MLNVQRILCAVQLRLDEIEVLSHACAIASPFHARVDALLVRPDEVRPSRSDGARAQLTPELDASHEAELLFATLLSGKDTIRVKGRVVSSDPHAILAQSAECNSDLIVVAARRTLASQEQRPALSDELGRSTGCPILTVPLASGASSVTRILLPVDFSPATARAVEWATLLAHRFSATVRVLHAVGSAALRSEPPRHGETVQTSFTRAHAMIEEVEQRLRQNGVTCETTIAEQGTTHAILACREREESDLIVMGMHPHENERTASSGMVSSIRRRATVPVLSIMTPEAEDRMTLSDPVRDNVTWMHRPAPSAGMRHAVASAS
ncbi:MAG TPA: universal stress protein [Polyangiaceae bacterium]|nr:universal stress protein [Polyangiaceae bacterium]